MRLVNLMSAQVPICEKAMTSSRMAGIAVQTISSLWLPWENRALEARGLPYHQMHHTSTPFVSTNVTATIQRIMSNKASILGPKVERFSGNHQPCWSAVTKV
jgi:hypothetical protein